MPDPTDDEMEHSNSAREQATPTTATQVSGKRARPDDIAEELTAKQVQDIISSVSKKREQVLHYIGTEKVSDNRKKLSDFVTEISDAITKLSNAYLSKLAVQDVAAICERAIYRACNAIDNAAKQLNTVQPSNQAPAVGVSFADVASRNAQQRSARPMACVSLDRGKPFPITRTDRIIIGPCESSKHRYADSKITKTVVQQCIDPVQYNMKINRVSFGPQCSVIVEGDALDPKSLATCTALGKKGLEVKEDVRRNPRLVIHDIPVELSEEQIITCLVEQNLPGVSVDDVKPIFLYPTGRKRFRSCIIETTPEHRIRLLNLRKVTIQWSACRIDDHVSILQCFRCHGFGHIASKCAANVLTCGKCAGEHITKDCESSNGLKCTNCVAAKLTNVAHAAYDKAKCPLLRKRIDRQMSFINYGS